MPREVYETCSRPVHVVIGARDGARVFTDAALAQAAFQPLVLHDSTLAAAVMPSHVHWLLSTTLAVSSTVGRYKSQVATNARQLGFQHLWQRSFWDHVVRSSKKLDLIVRYIVENPIRAGLCQRWEDYPYVIFFPDRIDDLK